MALTGFRRSTGKRSGGIRSIALVEASKIEAAEYDVATDSYTGLTLAEGSRFASYSFREDEALYTETAQYTSGSYVVSHQLSFLLERMDAGSLSAVEELAEATPTGIVAVVTTNNDVKLLVGYSEKFGTERPLRLEKSFGTTGQKLSDMTAETVLLTSDDTAKAKPFTGTL